MADETLKGQVRKRTCFAVKSAAVLVVLSVIAALVALAMGWFNLSTWTV